MFMTYLKNLIKLIGITIAGRIFWNCRLYQKYVVDQNNSSALKLISTDRFAIVMQGPLIVDSNLFEISLTTRIEASEINNI